MSKKLEITSIILTTAAGNRVELSLEEARDLYLQMVELFGPKNTVGPIIIDREVWPVRWLTAPPVRIVPGERPWTLADDTPQWTVTCKADSGLQTEIAMVAHG